MSNSPSRRPKLAAIALCLALGFIEAAQVYAGARFREDPHALRSAFVFGWLPWVPVAMLAPVLMWLAIRWPLDRGRWHSTLPLHLAAMAAFIGLHELVAALLLQPYVDLPFGFSFVKQLTYRSVIDAILYWAVVGVTHAIRAAREAREREQATVRLEAGLAEARLAALRAQLDPHFLFNTLNAISALALRGEREGVVQALSTLSELLRATLGGAPTQEIALADELSLLDRYLEIQQLRFSDRLEVVREIAPDALDAAVPAMLLQPLVENAVQHGVAVRPGPMRIDIRAERRDGAVRLEVRDTGPGFRPAGTAPNERREGIGLGNTRERLSQLYGTAQSLECRDADGAGALVAVTIPYRTMRVAPVGEAASAS